MAAAGNQQIDPNLPPADPGDGPPGQPIIGGGGGAGEVPPDPLDPYPEGTPDFRNDQSGMGPPNPDHYDPNEDVDQFGYQVGINGEKNYDINVGMTGGLMDTVTNMENSKFGNKGYGVAPGSATNRGVGQEELSQYQLNQMLASDSPLMRQAAEQGMARGGARGLMNSSMATGAAQGAMIAGAQPFALQDADRYGQTASENMAATNSMAEANLNMRGRSMEAGARRDITMLNEVATGYGDIRKAMMNIEDREDTQAYKDEDREDTQGFTGRQNQLNRDWTSNENMLTNSLQWATTKLNAAKDLKMSREQAFTEVMREIAGIENHKISATQRQNALKDARETLLDVYGDEEPSMYEMNYDPATGKSINPETGEENQAVNTDPPGVSTTRSGNTTVTTYPDGSINIQISHPNAEIEEEVNGMPDVAGGGGGRGGGEGTGGGGGRGGGYDPMLGTSPAPITTTGGGGGGGPFDPANNILT